MDGPKPIDCDLYDYVEIACMRGYELQIILNDHTEMVGKAKTTRTSADKVEYLVVGVDNVSVDVPMHEIKSIAPLTAGATFAKIDFSKRDGTT